MPDEFERPEGYLPRAVDATIDRYLRVFGAVEIAGTKWCGKTWSALMHGNSVSYVDENLALAKADPSLMLLGDRPHVIDEWQLVPEIRDRVRHEVDRSRTSRGAYILTGSSTPPSASREDTDEKDGAPSHSGAGRFGKVRMHPMSLAESKDSAGTVSLAGLFEGDFSSCAAQQDTLGLVDVTCRGGWPGAIDLAPDDALLIAKEYIAASLARAEEQLGLDADLLRRMIYSLARNIGQSTTYKTIIADMFGAEEDPSQFMNEDKARVYLNALKSMYLIEEVPGWAPPARSRQRFITKPKRYLADPSLAVSLLGMSPTALLKDWQTFGLMFENLAMRDLMVYARTLNLLDEYPVRYYHDDSGLEADAIIQLSDGRWAALECKVSEDKVVEGISSLKSLRRKVCENPRAQTPKPTFMAVITGNGRFAYMVEEGLFVIPIRTLTW